MGYFRPLRIDASRITKVAWLFILMVGSLTQTAQSQRVRTGVLPSVDRLAPFSSRSTSPDESLSGAWLADDGASYYIQQVGNVIWWVGMSGDGGRSFTNVFRGNIPAGSSRIVGSWVDLPLGASGQQGSLTLNIVHLAAPPGGASSVELERATESGGFGASRWRKGTVANPPGVDTSAATPSAAPSGRPDDVTGVWSCNDGGTYYVRKVGTTVWWLGLSGDGGTSFTNVFRGSWRPNPATEEPADFGTVDGEWADVPRAPSAQSGTLHLSFRFTQELWKRGQGGPFSGSVWKRIN